MTAVVGLGDAVGVAETVEARVMRLVREKGLSFAEVARRGGFSPRLLGTWGSRNKKGTQKGIRADTAQKIAKGLNVPVGVILGATPANQEVSFTEFVQWAHKTSAVAEALLKHGDEITVGDLLRYRSNPSAQGELDADEVWKQIVGLREGLDVTGGAEVTPEQEQQVGPKRRRRR